MRTPAARGSAVSLQRVRRWTNEFARYRHSITEARIRDWLGQFDDADRDLGARILDCVDFISHEQMSAAFRQVLAGLPGWHMTKTHRTGKWRFVAYSASAGESGDSMLHNFRHANRLSHKRYKELFIHRSDLLRAGLGAEDTVVLIGDFVGTGDQVCDAWHETFGELLTEVGNVYLVVVAARQKAVERVADETEMVVVPHLQLVDADNVFECRHFNDRERARIDHYGVIASRAMPRGHGECGLVVVFAHACPNNTIPILHTANRRWEGLFRRYD